MDGVGTSIVGRPRRLSADRRARPTYTFIWEEPSTSRGRLVRVGLEPGERVDRRAVGVDLEVQVRTSRGARAADRTDDRAHRDRLSRRDLDGAPLHVGVDALDALAVDDVVDDDVVAEAAAVELDRTHDALGDRLDGHA